MIETIRTWLDGKKTILTAVAGSITAVVTWSQHGIDTTTLAATVWAAVLVIFNRLGTAKAQNAAQANQDQAKAQ